MKYECVCEKCNNVTIVDTEVDSIGITPTGQISDTFVTCYGYLCTPCNHCGHYSFATWAGRDGKRFPRTGIFA